MKNPKVAYRYANALYHFAVENQKLEEVKNDFEYVKKVLVENRSLQVVIDSPVIFPDKKRKIFEAIYKDQLCDVTFGFLNLMIIKKREPSILMICDEFVKLYNRHHNIKVAHIVTAHNISNQLLKELQTILEEQTKSTIQIQAIVNPKLIGGITVQIDDFMFDASILSKINKLKSEFSQNIYQARY